MMRRRLSRRLKALSHHPGPKKDDICYATQNRQDAEGAWMFVVWLPWPARCSSGIQLPQPGGYAGDGVGASSDRRSPMMAMIAIPAPSVRSA